MAEYFPNLSEAINTQIKRAQNTEAQETQKLFQSISCPNCSKLVKKGKQRKIYMLYREEQ